MKIIKLKNEELEALENALLFYMDETTHERKDLPLVDGIVYSSPGLNPNSKESKLLSEVRRKLEQ